MSLRSIILEHVDIVELVNIFGANLKPCGDKFLGFCLKNDCYGRCFAVYPDKGEYECLECGAKGDTIDFLVDVIGFNFAEAHRWLINIFNIPIEDLLSIRLSYR